MNRAQKYLIEGSFCYHAVNVTNKSFKKLYKTIDRTISLALIKKLYAKGEIQKNKVFVMTYDNAFTCNPKYIVEELLRRNHDLDIVWVIPASMKAAVSIFPDQVRLVRRGTVEMFEEQASARVWLDNALNCVWFGVPKKKGQYYINTWHGSMGIKRLDGDRLWRIRAGLCNKLTDYCITNSTFEENVFREEFWHDVKFKKYGHARNDLFMNEERAKAAREKVCRLMSIKPDRRILLYAPTFRDNKSNRYLNLNLEEVRLAVEKQYGGSWVVLSRLHFKDRSRLAVPNYSRDVLDAGKYPDMQELLAAADMGITDYSSWAYDYILLKRPLFIYAPDLEDYADGRGFYFPIESTPFPIATDIDELMGCIQDFDREAYLKGVDEFLKDKGCYETGAAARKTADLIEAITGTLTRD